MGYAFFTWNIYSSVRQVLILCFEHPNAASKPQNLFARFLSEFIAILFVVIGEFFPIFQKAFLFKLQLCLLQEVCFLFVGFYHVYEFNLGNIFLPAY